MDRLKQDLTFMLNAGEPAAAQLLSTIQQQTSSLEQDTISAPQRIKDIVAEEYLAGLGWDTKRKLVKDKSKFSSSNVVPTLTSLLNVLNNWSPPKQPTAEELQDFSKACGRLWELDAHRLVAGKDYIINVQQGKNIYDSSDAAKLPLFSFVDERVFSELPTYSAFIALLDNYLASLGQSEVVTDAEKNENMRFLNLIMDTAVMQYTHNYLLQKKLTTSTTRSAFVQELYQLWFGLYKRKVANDSSGFEHVFVGEVKEENCEITGFHNWIQIYLEEKKGHFDYRGFIKPKRKGWNKGPASTEQFVSIQFVWNGALKNVSSSFVGTSPEFEFALYTLCFFTKEEKMLVECGPYKIEMTCFRWTVKDKVYIATSFPAEAPVSEDEAATKIQAQFRGKSARNARTK